MRVIQVKASHKSQGDYVRINDTDYDEDKHELYTAGKDPDTLQFAKEQKSAKEKEKADAKAKADEEKNKELALEQHAAASSGQPTKAILDAQNTPPTDPNKQWSGGGDGGEPVTRADESVPEDKKTVEQTAIDGSKVQVVKK